MLARCALAPEKLLPLSDEPQPASQICLEDFPELRGVPWFPALGDGAASNLGCGATKPGVVAINVGTSAAVRAVRESGPARTPFGLFCYRVDSKRQLIGGASSNAGNLRAWCLRELRLPDDPLLPARAQHRHGPRRLGGARRAADGGTLGPDDDLSVLAVAEPDLTWLADARLDVSPEVVADPDVLRPLHAYALTHATGDPSYLADAFLPTAHIEGYRDGAFVSWDLAHVRRGLHRPGRRRAHPPPTDRATRRPRLCRHCRDDPPPRRRRLHRRLRPATRPPIRAWRIANKAYERRTA